MLRALPIATTAGMEVTVLEELQTLCAELGCREGSAVIIDPRGICVWSGNEVSESSVDGVWRALTVEVGTSAADLTMGANDI